MAGETILARVRDQATVVPNKVAVGWFLSAPVVSSVDGMTYQAGVDFVTVNLATDTEGTIQKKVRDQIAARVSEVTGGSYTAADVRGFKAVRAGTVNVSALETSKAVAFATDGLPPIDMPSANYRILCQPQVPMAVNIGYSSKTATGFTLDLSTGVSGAIDWLAVEDG